MDWTVDDIITIYGPVIYTAPSIRILMRADGYTVKNAVELFFAFHPDVEKIQYY